ncbi:ATP-binding protein [Thermodesulfitimonas sp.]
MRGIKIAVSGKGGAGKTTLAAALIRTYAATHRRVYAVDADPDASLALALGLLPEEAAGIRPVIELKDQIREIMGGEGEFFRLNPELGKVLDDFCYRLDNILFIRMGELKKAGTSCYCRENAFLNALVSALLLERDEVVVMDMPAGIEHLSRGTARGVDVMVIVTEPNERSIHTAKLVEKLAVEIGVPWIIVVGNKVRSPDEAGKVAATFPGKVKGMLPFDEMTYQGGEPGGEFWAAVKKLKDVLEGERERDHH